MTDKPVQPLSAEEWERRMKINLTRLRIARDHVTEAERDIQLMLRQWIVRPE